MDRDVLGGDSKNSEVLEHVLSNAVEGIFLTLPNGKYVTVNKALADIYGYDSEEDLLNSISNIGVQLYVDPNKRNEFVRLMDEHHELLNFEAEIYRKDKSKIWIREDVRAVFDDNGDVVYYEGFVADITEVKKFEKLITTKNEQLKELNKSLEQKVEERTRQLFDQKKITDNQNKQLKELLKELVQVKVTRKATTVAIIITLLLFIISEGFIEPAIEDSFKHEAMAGFLLKGVIALTIKPIEWIVQMILNKKKSKDILGQV